MNMMNEPFTNAGQRILVIDDEPVVGLSVQRILREDGHEVSALQNPLEGIERARASHYDVILLDLMMPEMGGIDVLKQLKSSGVAAEVVIITGYSEVQTAVEAMKEGAADYVSKPFTPDELRMIVRKVVERSSLISENAALRQQLYIQQGFAGIVGGSRAMERVFSLMKRVSPTDGTVLITGESGTGKEMVARAIHKLSRRKDGPFVPCDCSALASSLLESELFGHVKGAFTGAIGEKQGLFELADGGTLFLDEVSNISSETQGKLLRVLESRRVRPVGAVEEREVDIRLIAATNRDLQEMVKEGEFREDLYYRLNVVPLELPALRTRGSDIALLATSFLERFAREMGVGVHGFTPEALALMEAYDWPGNVRELRNIVERVAILCDAERVEPRHLPPELLSSPETPRLAQLPRRWEEFKRLKGKLRAQATQELEKRFLLEALERTGGNVSRAAEEVGMQRTNFHSLLRRHGIHAEDS